MATYLIGDTHFNEPRIFNMCTSWHRPFGYSEVKDETLIKNWNEIVTPNDTVIVIGDFGDPTFADKLNGEIILIMGNHDYEWDEHNLHFDYVSPHPILYKGFYILSHEPLYVSANGVMANIFAHVHDNPNYKNFSSRGACVSAERIGWRPILFEEAIEKMKEEEKK